MRFPNLFLACAFLLGETLGALAQSSVPNDQAPAQTGDARDSTNESICLMVEAAARANTLPLDFFARIIWQESRFQPQAVGPLTRSGARAQGIAQFMPSTACSIRSIRLKRCPSQPNSWPSCGVNSAISDWRLPPTTPARSASVISSPGRAACRRRPAATCWR